MFEGGAGCAVLQSRIVPAVVGGPEAVDGYDAVVAAALTPDDDSLGLTGVHDLDLRQIDADHLPARRDDEHLVPFFIVHFCGRHDLGIHHRAGGLVTLVHGKGLDPHAAAIGFTIHRFAPAVAQRRGLAVALFAHHQQVFVLGIVDHVERHHAILAPEFVLELDADHAGGVTVTLGDAGNRT